MATASNAAGLSLVRSLSYYDNDYFDELPGVSRISIRMEPDRRPSGLRSKPTEPLKSDRKRGKQQGLGGGGGRVKASVALAAPRLGRFGF